jgi:hypothetical protein
MGLIWNGTAAPATQPLMLNARSRLAGTGTIHRPVTFSFNTFLSPGTPTSLNASTPGTLTLDALTLSSSTTSQFNLATPNVTGGTGGATNDLVAVLANLTLDGRLLITKATTFTIGTYTLFTYAGTLTDNGLTLPAAPVNFAYSLDLSIPGKVNLHYGFLGDANDDGIVNFEDFITLANHFGGQNTGWAQADFNNDGTTNFQDYILLANNFGQSISGSAYIATADELAAIKAFAAAPIPEPATLALLLPAALLLKRRR